MKIHPTLKNFFKNTFPRVYAYLFNIRQAQNERNVFFFPKANVVYLPIPKCGCSTIFSLLVMNELELNEIPKQVHSMTYKFNIDPANAFSNENNPLVFTFVRNPLIRIVSCYKNLVVDITENDIAFPYYPGVFSREMTFAEFVDKIIYIPDWRADRHFKSQSAHLRKPGLKKIDYIGKLENFDEDIKQITDRIEIPYIDPVNVSSRAATKLEEYYTKEVAEKVHKRYLEDFRSLGYEDSYKSFYDSLPR